jgi:hypothetical protein
MVGWRVYLVNRFTISLCVIGIIVFAILIYMAYNGDGILEGRVVNQDGMPAAGVTVTILKPGVVGFDRIGGTVTDAKGHFRFEKHNQHHPFLKAERSGVGASDLVGVRLYFRNENRILSEPLRLKPRS